MRFLLFLYAATLAACAPLPEATLPTTVTAVDYTTLYTTATAISYPTSTPIRVKVLENEDGDNTPDISDSDDDTVTSTSTFIASSTLYSPTTVTITATPSDISSYADMPSSSPVMDDPSATYAPTPTTVDEPAATITSEPAIATITDEPIVTTATNEPDTTTMSEVDSTTSTEVTSATVHEPTTATTEIIQNFASETAPAFTFEPTPAVIHEPTTITPEPSWTPIGEPVTNSISEPPSTTTSHSISTATTQPTYTTASRTAGSGPTTTWIQPATMTDLSAWGTNKLPGYVQRDLAVVSEVPASAYASALTAAGGSVGYGVPDNFAFADLLRAGPSTENLASSSIQASDNKDSGPILRLLYPAGSINPSSQNPGGADFYANLLKPSTLVRAKTVTLTYQVFFPTGFSFVKAGKLPGLFGGHRGCSGGNSADECWSTRLMWRAKGAGELYLYAPKTQQTRELCNTPPMSVCDTTYGFSIGRGSFKFQTGGWTHVKQTVTLNTPGVPNGLFILEVDGREVIRRDDVVYRAARQVPSSAEERPNASDDSSSSDGTLGGALDQLLDGLLRRDANPRETFPVRLTPDGQIHVSSSPRPETNGKPQLLAFQANADDGAFGGLFFSTFFGGHTRDYASPRDQYVYFGGFEMTAA